MRVVRFQDRPGVFVYVCRVTENQLNSLAVRNRPGPVDTSRNGLDNLRFYRRILGRKGAKCGDADRLIELRAKVEHQLPQHT